jgi:hypothetical protein
MPRADAAVAAGERGADRADTDAAELIGALNDSRTGVLTATGLLDADLASIASQVHPRCIPGASAGWRKLDKAP